MSSESNFGSPTQKSSDRNITGSDTENLHPGVIQDAVLQTAEQTALRTLNAIGEGVALCCPDGVIRSVNPAFESSIGYDKDDLLGRNIKDLLSDCFDQGDATLQDFIDRVRLQQPGKDPQDAFAIPTGGDSCKWVIPSLATIRGPQNEVISLVLTLRDVSLLMQTQAELQSTSAEYRALVENTNSIIIRVTPQKELTFLNEYAQTFFGYSAGELLGRNLVGSILPETDSEGRDLKSIVEAFVEHPELHGAQDTEARRKDGTIVWVHWSNRAIRDELGHVSEILCVGLDITQRKQLEEQSESYRRRLRKMAAKLASTEEQDRRIIAECIHDTIIQTLSLSNIRLGGVAAELQKHGLIEDHERVAGIRQLLERGISESRELMGELAPSMLYEVGLGAALRHFAEKQAKLDNTCIKVEDDTVDLDLDAPLRSLLFQCAKELVMNALKYAGDCKIDVRLSSGESVILLQVSDTGKGFDIAEIHGASEDNSRGGFGLFNIRQRLEDAGGSLDIESTPGKGTVVTVVAPQNMTAEAAQDTE